jgi:polyisoprenoid-binding protein YceI
MAGIQGFEWMRQMHCIGRSGAAMRMPHATPTRPTTMRTRTLGALLLCLAAAAAFGQQAPPLPATPASGPVKGARYAVDPTHTFVLYEIGHYGTSTNRGRFSTKDGIVQIDPSGRSGRVDITMDIGSINTGVELLNRHLKSKDFFNVAEHPTGRFVAEQMVLLDEKVQELKGTLTLLGRTNEVVLRVNRFGCYTSPLIKRQVCGGDFETRVQRSLWGIDWGLSFGFEDEVRLLVQVEAVHMP